MRRVSTREVNQAFSRLLDEVEGGEELVVTRRGKPVARLIPYREPEMTPAREAARERALARLGRGLPLGITRPLARDEMHER